MIVLATAFAVTPGDAAPDRPVSGSRTRAKSASKSKSKSASKSKSKHRRSRRKHRRGRRRGALHDFKTKRYYDGMPPGFTWPPTAAMADAGKACEAELDRAGVKWTHVKRSGRIADPIEVTDHVLAGVTYTNWFGPKASTKMECQLALALLRIGPELRALGVREVQYGQVFDWSHIDTIHGRKLSRHAVGLAMDIGAFVDDSGRVVKVLHNYQRGDSLLLSLEELFEANVNFHNLLTPRIDPAGHSNHFHVEAVASFRRPGV